MAGERVQRRLAAILAADVVEYSRLVEGDEAGTRAKFNAHLEELINPAISDRGGRLVKTTGDGLLVEFASVVDAVECALDVQRGMALRNTDAEPRMDFRIGVHLGDVIVEEDDIHGDGVNVAARLEGIAEPAGICISGTVFDSIQGKLSVGIEDLGNRRLKNIERPVHAYRLLTEPDACSGRAAATSTGRARLKRLAIAAAVLVAIAAVGVVWWEPWVTRVEPASIERMAFPLPAKPSIAVLPFDSLSSDPDQDYFADGLTEEIINSLASFENIFVIARYSTNKFKGKAVDVRTVSEDLGVRYVLEGSVRRASNNVRITVQMVDALNGRHVWANKYNRQLKDIFVLLDEISLEIASRVVSKLEIAKFEQRSRKLTESPEAYEYFLLGWRNFQRFTKEANGEAIKFFERALEIDPNYARAYSYLAYARRTNARRGWVGSPKDTLDHALKLARKGASIDPKDSVTQHFLGNMYHQVGQIDLAIETLGKAIALSPSAPDHLIAYAVALAQAGRAGDAVRNLQAALRLNPHPPLSYTVRAVVVYYFSERYEDASAAFERVLRRRPNYRGLAGAWRAAIYAQLGRMEDARPAREAYLKLDPDYSIQGFFKRAKYPDRARALLEEGLRKAGYPEYPPLKLPDKPSIAVLPFTNMSDDKAQEYFSDGITEDIITDLSKVSGLFVIAPDSSFKYKGKSVDVRDVGRDLGVRHILEGSVRRSGSQLRINVQLVDAQSGSNIWTERYDRAPKDVFAIQDEIAERVVNELSVTLKANEQERLYRRHTENVEAYDTFLQARRLVRLYRDPKILAKRRRLFEKVIELDPSFAGGYAGLSFLYSRGVRQAHSPTPEKDNERALELAKQAMAIDDTFAWSYLALASAYLNNHEQDKAVATMQRAIRIQPSDADAYTFLGYHLHWAGRGEDAISAVKKGIRLNPHRSAAGYLGMANFTAGRYEDAIAAFNNAHHLFARTGANALCFLAAAYAAVGKIDKARSEIKAFLDKKPGRTIENYPHPRYYKRKEDLERYLDFLRKAGMKEK